MKYGYIRLTENSKEQDSLIYDLKQAGCIRIFKEKADAIKKLEGFEELVQILSPGDTVIIGDIKSLEWFIKQTADNFEILRSKKTALISLDKSIDTRTAKGIFAFNFVCSLSTIEKNLLKHRTIKLLKKARANGRIGGKKKGLTKKAKTIARKAFYLNSINNNLSPKDPSKKSVTQMSKELGIGKATFYRYLEFVENENNEKSKN